MRGLALRLNARVLRDGDVQEGDIGRRVPGRWFADDRDPIDGQAHCDLLAVGGVGQAVTSRGYHDDGARLAA